MSKAHEILTSQTTWGTNEERMAACAILLEHEDDRAERMHRGLTHLGWMAIVVTLSLLAMCCAARPNVRTIEEEHAASVRIVAVCANGMGYGSGVILTPHTVLTAHHVVDGDGCVFIAYVPGDADTGYLMAVNHVFKDRDVAELFTVSPLPYTPIEFGPTPQPGETACVVSAFPGWLRRCGDVQYFRDAPPGDVAIDVVVEPGNSGSGVYDARGRLVGITTHLRSCRNGQWCGGKFSSLEFLWGVL
jgi:S1-C subfamily serine protease